MNPFAFKNLVLAAIALCAMLKIPTCTSLQIIVPPFTNKVATIAAGASYAVYSFAVDKYANRIVKRMQDVPTPEQLIEIEAAGKGDLPRTKPTTLSLSQLRATVSKRTNIVARNEDRLAWNQWIAAPAATQKSQQEQVVDSSLIRSLYQCGNGRMVHQFKYRTYSNFEEAGAICKPFYTWRRLGPVFRKPGELEFLPPTQTRTDDDEDVPVLALVVNTEEFSLGIFLSLKIQWRGHVIQRGANASANAKTKQNQSRFCIDWTHTELEINFPGGKKIVKENPKISTELSSIPWDVEKAEDGMICFRRGDIGHLVYDAN